MTARSAQPAVLYLLAAKQPQRKRLYLAEVDGNRTRRTGIARPNRFEGGGAHQVLVHLQVGSSDGNGPSLIAGAHGAKDLAVQSAIDHAVGKLPDQLPHDGKPGFRRQVDRGHRCQMTGAAVWTLHELRSDGCVRG